MDVMLDIDRLTKRFGPITAVEDVSFKLARGEVLGFLGPNGAGKSTTMKMVTGYLPPTSGRATVCGFDVIEAPLEVQRRIGYVAEGAPLYEDMTPMSLLGFAAAVRGMGGRAARAAVDEAIAALSLEEMAYRPVGTLSKGYKRRVGLAQALLHKPEVLILDEPTEGLDPNQKHEVRSLINRIADRSAIIISTHILEEVDAVCTRAIIIARGRIVLDCTPAELEARSRYHNAVSILCAAGVAASAQSSLETLDAVDRIERLNDVDGAVRLTAFPKGGRGIIADVSAHLRASSIPVNEIRLERGHLDQVFRHITMPPGGLGV